MRGAADFRVMGVVNVTPDSFSDGGRYMQPERAISHGLELAAEGAAIIDVGGQSTRPGATPVAAEEELDRVLPVIAGLTSAGTDVQISVDTSRVSVASKALDAGATLINDVTALRGDPEMASLVAASGAQVCLMHMLGEPRTMQDDPRYEDVVSEVKAFLEERLQFAVREGADEQRILLDPGIGFGKTVSHNLELIDRLDEIVALGRPVAIGASRKSFIGRITGRQDPFDRVAGTVAINALAYERGARIFRVHDVAPSRDGLAMAAATVSRRWTETTRPTSSTT